jgi:hypothetical protein
VGTGGETPAQAMLHASLASGSVQLCADPRTAAVIQRRHRWPDAEYSNLFEFRWFFGTKNTSGSTSVSELNATSEGSQSLSTGELRHDALFRVLTLASEKAGLRHRVPRSDNGAAARNAKVFSQESVAHQTRSTRREAMRCGSILAEATGEQRSARLRSAPCFAVNLP